MVHGTEFVENYYLAQSNKGLAIITAQSNASDSAVIKKFSIGTQNSVPFSLHTNNIERLLVDPIGNIGINTISPKSKLQITGGDIFIEDINKGVIIARVSVVVPLMTELSVVTV